jgi:thymidylate synthase
VDNCSTIRKTFIDLYTNKQFVQNPRDGKQMIEIIGASFIADEGAIFGEPNNLYINSEIDWYARQSLNINEIYKDGKEPPMAWKLTANPNGYINSNYGWLIWSKDNGHQYQNVLTELKENPISRRASMIYQRPSIWTDWCAEGKNDFICTNAVTYYLRDDKLHAVVQMRSNDVVFGYKNDFAWQKYVMGCLLHELNEDGHAYSPGNIHWQVQNLHVYERHFNLIL